MKRIISALLIGTGLIFATGCEEEIIPEITLTNESDSNITLACEGESKSIEFTSNVAWNVTPPEVDWLTVTPESGEAGTTSITATAKEYTGLEARSASFSINVTGKSISITVHQVAMEVELVLEDESQTEISIPQTGGSVSIPFYTNIAWTTTIPEGAFFTVTPESGEAGDVVITVEADTNDTFDMPSASFTINAANQQISINVTQSQIDTLAIPNYYYSANCDEGTVDIIINTNIEFEYKLIEEYNWISIAETKAIEEKSITLSYAANGTFQNRTAGLEISHEITDGIKYDTVYFTQSASKWAKVLSSTLDDKNVSLATLGGQIIVCYGDGTPCSVLDMATGEQVGTYSQTWGIDYVDNDDAGNLILTKNNAYDPSTSWWTNNYQIYYTTSLSAEPILLVDDYQGGFPNGYKVSVRGDVTKDALIVSPCEAIPNFSLTNSITYWTITDGSAPVFHSATVTGIVGVNWLPGHWNSGNGNRPALSAVSADINDGLIFSVYDENIVYHLTSSDGATFSATKLLTGTSSNQAYNTSEVRSFGGLTVLAISCPAFWPQWGYSPELYLYNISDLSAIAAEGAAVNTSSYLIATPGTTSMLDWNNYLDSYNPTADICFGVDANGNYYLVHADYPNNVVEAYIVNL